VAGDPVNLGCGNTLSMPPEEGSGFIVCDGML